MAAGLWVGVSGYGAARALESIRSDGRGHTAVVWVESEVVRWVDNRSGPFPVLYASEPALLAIQSGRSSFALPRNEEELTAFAERFRERPGAVVITGQGNARRPDGLTFARLLGLVEVVDAPEGQVWVPANRP